MVCSSVWTVEERKEWQETLEEVKENGSEIEKICNTT